MVVLFGTAQAPFATNSGSFPEKNRTHTLLTGTLALAQRT